MQHGNRYMYIYIYTYEWLNISYTSTSLPSLSYSYLIFIHPSTVPPSQDTGVAHAITIGSSQQGETFWTSTVDTLLCLYDSMLFFSMWYFWWCRHFFIFLSKYFYLNISHIFHKIWHMTRCNLLTWKRFRRSLDAFGCKRWNMRPRCRRKGGTLWQFW